MKILICPDKFKGSLTAEEVCASLRDGILHVQTNAVIKTLPMADGGDGSVEIIKTRFDLKEVAVQTVDPLGRKLSTTYSISIDAAFIELASASGLVLLKEDDRNPMLTSTRGTGLEIKDALEKGIKKFYLFIGGSATNDAGIGIAQALGFGFLDAAGNHLEPIGKNLSKIASIQNNKLYDFDQIEINALCDVTNPMYGPRGAAHTYAKQKGAKEHEVLELDQGLKNYAQVLKEQMHMDLASTPGVGAAGAVCASLHSLLGAQLQNGFQMLADIMDLETQIKGADLVISGEGKIDSTSFQGKVVGNVLELCKKHNKPCGIVGGMIDDLKANASEFLFHHSIMSRAENLSDAMLNSRQYLFEIGKEIGKLAKSQL